MLLRACAASIGSPRLRSRAGKTALLFGTIAVVETRVAPRLRVKKAAKIDHGGDKIACTIRDLSSTGAALELGEMDSRIPDAFTLVVPEDGLKLPCHVVWRRDFRMGVAFD